MLGGWKPLKTCNMMGCMPSTKPHPPSAVSPNLIFLYILYGVAVLILFGGAERTATAHAMLLHIITEVARARLLLCKPCHLHCRSSTIVPPTNRKDARKSGFELFRDVAAQTRNTANGSYPKWPNVLIDMISPEKPSSRTVQRVLRVESLNQTAWLRGVGYL